MAYSPTTEWAPIVKCQGTSMVAVERIRAVGCTRAPNRLSKKLRQRYIGRRLKRNRVASVTYQSIRPTFSWNVHALGSWTREVVAGTRSLSMPSPMIAGQTVLLHPDEQVKQG